MSDCPWSHSERGNCVLRAGHLDQHRFARDEPAPAPSVRAAGALRRVASMLDTVIKAYQDARDLASEEGSPLSDEIDERIMGALVQADCSLRTQSSLRAARDSKRPDLVLEMRPPRPDGDPR